MVKTFVQALRNGWKVVADDQRVTEVTDERKRSGTLLIMKDGKQLSIPYTASVRGYVFGRPRPVLTAPWKAAACFDCGDQFTTEAEADGHQRDLHDTVLHLYASGPVN